MKIACCIPHNYPNFEPDFVISLIAIVRDFYQWNAKNGNKHELIVLRDKEGWIDRMRENLAQAALEKEADYMLWLDTDMIFPQMLLPNMINLLEAQPKYEAVTGLYNWKKPPFMPHVYTKFDVKDKKFDCAGGFPTRQAFPVEGAGFGCLFIKSSVFKRVKRPWFDFKFGKHGEDLYFFMKARPIKMLCHPKLVCPHITSVTVDINTYLTHNKLNVDNKGIIKITKKELKSISDEQQKLFKKFESKV